MNNISPRQYEIWITDLDPAVGSEPGKKRPVAVLQSDVLNSRGHSSIIVCVISSQHREGTAILRLPVAPTLKNGLVKQSYLLCDHIRAIDLSRFDSRVGSLDADTINKLKESLTVILDLQ